MSRSDRIKEIRAHFFDGDNTAFAHAVGEKPNTVSNWVNREPGSVGVYVKITDALPSVSLDWLLTGVGEMLIKSKDVTMHYTPPYYENNEEQSVLLYDIDAAANLQTIFTNRDENVLEKMIIPYLPKVDGAIRVRGDSMYPLLHSGDIIIYKETRCKDTILYGEMYLVEFSLNEDYHLVVKFVNKSEIDDHINLSSYNQHYQSIDIPNTSIRAMALVKASIRINAMI